MDRDCGYEQIGALEGMLSLLFLIHSPFTDLKHKSDLYQLPPISTDVLGVVALAAAASSFNACKPPSPCAHPPTY